MKRMLFLTLALLCAMVIAGCIDYDETLELNADGSGTMTTHFSIYKKAFEALAAMGEPVPEDSAQGESLFPVIERANIEEKLKNYKGNVQLLDFKQTENDSVLSYDIKYSFKNLQDMLEISENLGKDDVRDEASAEPSSTPKITFDKDESGQWQYTRGFQAAEMGEMIMPTEDSSTQESAVTSSTEAVDSTAEPMAQALDTAMSQMGTMMTSMADMMSQAFGDHKVRMTVKFPGTVAESNATSVKGNTAVWEYKFIDMAKAPKQLKATIKP